MKLTYYLFLPTELGEGPHTSDNTCSKGNLDTLDVLDREVDDSLLVNKHHKLTFYWTLGNRVKYYY